METPLNNEQITIIVDKVLSLLPAESFDIDTDLLLLAITSKSGKDLINYTIKKRQIDKYGSDDYERLEFFGDSIIELVLSNIMFYNFTLTSRNLLVRALDILRSNHVLSCLSKSSYLCEIAITKFISDKLCPDILGSLVGAIYLNLKDKNPDYMNIITKWLLYDIGYQEVILDLFSHRKTKCLDGLQIEHIPINTGISTVIPTLKSLQIYTAKEIEDIRKEVKNELKEQIRREIVTNNTELQELRNRVEAETKLELDKLKDISTDRLKLELRAIGQLISSRTPKDPVTKLKELFERNYLGMVDYQDLGNNTIGVACPDVLCLTGKTYLGYGTYPLKVNARKIAAEQSIITLNNMGYI